MVCKLVKRPDFQSGFPLGFAGSNPVHCTISPIRLSVRTLGFQPKKKSSTLVWVTGHDFVLFCTIYLEIDRYAKERKEV